MLDSFLCDSLINGWTDILNKLLRDEGTGSSWGRGNSTSPRSPFAPLSLTRFCFWLNQSTVPPYTSTCSIPETHRSHTYWRPINPGGKSWLSPTIKQNSERGKEKQPWFPPSSLSWSCSKIKHNKVTWCRKTHQNILLFLGFIYKIRIFKQQQY